MGKGKKKKDSKEKKRLFESGNSKEKPINPEAKNPFVEKSENKTE